MAAMAGPEVGLCFHSARVEGQEEDQVDRPLYEGIEMEQEADLRHRQVVTCHYAEHSHLQVAAQNCQQMA